MASVKHKLKQRRIKKRVDKAAEEQNYIAQEMYRKNLELARTNHTLSLLRTIDNLVLESENSLSDLSQGIATALVEDSTYMFSLLFMKNSRESTLPMQVGGYGVAQELSKESTEFITDIKMTPDKDWAEALTGSEIVDLTKSSDDFMNKAFGTKAHDVKAFAKSFNAESMCIVKLLAQRKLVGVMLIGLSTSASALSVEEIAHLGRIGEAVGIALDNKLLFEENQHVLKQLKKSNEKLKALDEAKDEFISMASHQLRTPLTSVKGYISMVLDGDVGKVSTQQKEMLEQAFGSSQRMVYLIADLLNVSRLKTGKFVIESAPTQLADVVESEMAQLKETAKVRNLELTYVKPANFPSLNLDETKTRQVIMNFIDNAIYYTPTGGHIRVELSANDKTVEYKVVDDGLGVPKSEQPHLFTKFFRAGNARKARPDGTGLGLFMAKKVIVAQGGALIFKSIEGKGSTFGFTFPLHAVHANEELPKKVV